MSVEFLNALSVFFLLLLLGSIALSVYLLYDLISGNYRKFLSTGENHADPAEKAQGLRGQNIGE